MMYRNEDYLTAIDLVNYMLACTPPSTGGIIT